MGELGSSSLSAACSIVVKSPLFLGLKLSVGMAGGGDLISEDNGVGGLIPDEGFLSNVEFAELGIGKVVFNLLDDAGDITGNPTVFCGPA